MIGKEKCGEGKEPFLIMKHIGGVRTCKCLSATGTGSFDNLTKQQDILMNSEVYMAMLSAQIQTNAPKLIA